MSVAALVLAFFTWRFVERPFRERRRFNRRFVARIAVLASLALVAVGATGRYTALGSNAQRFNFSAEELAAIHPPNGNEAVSHCRWQIPLADFPRIRTCKFGAADGQAPVLLFGDSHADALFSALDQAFRQRNTAGLLIKDGYCGAIVGIYDRNKSSARVHRRCVEAHRAMLDYARKISAQGMVVSIRWTFQLYPVKGAIDQLDYDSAAHSAGRYSVQHLRVGSLRGAARRQPLYNDDDHLSNAGAALIADRVVQYMQ